MTDEADADPDTESDASPHDGPDGTPEGGPGANPDGEAFDAMGWWDDLEADVSASAAEYEDRGWETLELHTGDVTALDGEYGDRVGLSVLVPDDEFDALADHLADGAVTGYEVYRTRVGGTVALLVALEDESRERAVLFPAYYGADDERARRLFEQARADGELPVHLRTLSDDRVEVRLSEPELLAPPDD